MSVKINIKHLLILLISVLAVIFVGIKIYDSAYENYAPHYVNQKAENAEQISAEEVRAFLKTLLKYREKKQDLPAEELSYSLSQSFVQTEPGVTAWLKRHGWNADRFFYIANRIRLIINTIHKDKILKEQQDLMREGIQVSEDASLTETLKREVDMQEQKFNIEKISVQERNLIEPQMDVLSEILQMN